MKLSQFREWTKDYDGDVEIIVAAGMAGIKGIESGSLAPSDIDPRAVKVWSIADATDRVVLEL